MARGIKWSGANKALGPPKGVEEDQVHTLHVFNNGACSVSCWELSDEDIAEVIRTRRLFASVWYGPTQPPMAIGTEEAIHQLVADSGAVWKMGD